MRGFRRLVLSIGIACSLISVATVGTVGAAGGFGVGAGTFTFNDSSAFVSVFNPIDQSSINLNVDHGTFLSRPRHSGQLQTSDMTTLSITQFIPNPDPTQPPTTNATCLVIPDSDFTLSGDLQTAKLTVVNESTLCPGFLVPVTGAAIKPQAGGGGGGSTIPLPISATVTWTGNGAVGVTTDNGTFRCLTFHATTHNRGQQALSSGVTGSITANGAAFSSFSGGQQSGVFGSAATNTSVQNIAGPGILPAACGGKGG